MADFDVVETEGLRYLRMEIQDEEVRAEAGALSHLRGDIEVVTPIPTIGRAIAATLSDEPLIRPRFRGSGEIFLEPSLGGYHVFEVQKESWILENGAYWASEGGVDLGVHREGVITSLYAGEGFIDYQTKLAGRGKVVLNSWGPVEEIELNGETISAEGKLVIARTEGLTYRVRRPTRFFSYYLSGESLFRTYSGVGRVLLVKTPYLSARLMSYMEEH
jgi:uncharacterized protein (AIM24 family)